MGLSLVEQQEEQTRIWNEEIKPFVAEASIKKGKLDYHTLAELRAKHILEQNGYHVQLEKDIGYLKHWDEKMPNYKRTLDIYATKREFRYLHSTELDSQTIFGWFTRIIEIGEFGDGTYHSKKYMIARDKTRKEMVCEKFKIPSNNYIIANRDALTSKKYAMSNDYFVDEWNLS